MRALVLAFALCFAFLSLAPLAAATNPCGVAYCTPFMPGLCTWNKGECGPLDIVCVTINAQPVECVEAACNTQTGCEWPPQLHICGDPCY